MLSIVTALVDAAYCWIDRGDVDASAAFCRCMRGSAGGASELVPCCARAGFVVTAVGLSGVRPLLCRLVF